ncbi:enoyl-CoA hydratase/isomerase family protein [Sphingopyxis sp.]|jgi:2-(1,2-epoxy-1,2-dihydrophenyl)acetyl-CoA isomerase|uniref:enoyl-CoA hydratase/isomerase family protein n=1 Tax=Sphingopyxis sp. TaxID=1908224 RepID=UPI002DF7AE54|nr:enoyl-CoA hydratase-related protein [Sphingopyxis sp.]
MTDIMIKSAIDAGVMTVRLSRPSKMNALTGEMIAELHSIFVAIRTNPLVRCVLIEAEGRAFCAGRDLADAGANEDAEVLLNSTVNPMIEALYACEKPTIAAVNGVAMGIGLGLCLACDIVYAGTSASFASPFANLGAALDSGGHFFLPRLIGSARTLELIYTARSVDGQEAERFGLVNKAVADDVLASSTRALAHRIATGPATAFAGQKALLRTALASDLHGVLAAEARLQGELANTEDYAEGLAAFREKRRPMFGGASKGTQA